MTDKKEELPDINEYSRIEYKDRMSNHFDVYAENVKDKQNWTIVFDFKCGTKKYFLRSDLKKLLTKMRKAEIL